VISASLQEFNPVKSLLRETMKQTPIEQRGDILKEDLA
jgi:hypothetical protein